MCKTHRFGVFAKHWMPGKVKTRLAATIGPEKSAAIYKAFLVEQILHFAEMPEAEIVFAPEDSAAHFSDLLTHLQSPGWSLHPQGEGDLGDRMQRFFARAFADGFAKATLVGSDTPTLPISFLRQADELLNIHDVVLGPTEDGGYYLVAAKASVPLIFTEISWSSDQVWRQTIAKLQEHRVRFAVLPVWYDVDDADDLHRLHGELEDSPSAADAIHLARQLNEILNTESG